MAVSRRTFLSATAAATASVVAARPAAPVHAAPEALPSREVIALNRMGFGPRAGDVARVRAMGLAAYIEEQLQPQALDDAACNGQLAAARLRISYGASTGYPARNEAAPLTLLDAPISTLWARARYDVSVSWQERMRPWEEVRMATWLRAVYSKRQLLEVLADFWHNHFNVNTSNDTGVAVSFPVYDREVIRGNALGTFRQFLESVATSTAMLFYLDNRSNKTAGGEGSNENFCRELFELHTLSADNYRRFDESAQIPVGTDGVALCYTDEDVYQAADCFSGWTVEQGRHWDSTAANTGAFYYDANWHDPDIKYVLNVRIPRNQPALSDGRKVLDLLAYHPGTARHLCTKLCRRLIADNPPTEVIDAATAKWLATQQAPDQIRQVVRVILQSEAFQTTWGQKIKRPFEAAVSYLRATNAELPTDAGTTGNATPWNSMLWHYNQSGQRLFEWAAPTGHPDYAGYWATTNGLLKRWNLPYAMEQEWGGRIVFGFMAQTNMQQSCVQIVDAWLERLCGFSVSTSTRQALIDFMRQGKNATERPSAVSGPPEWNDAAALTDRLASMVQLIAMSPEFQQR